MRKNSTRNAPVSFLTFQESAYLSLEPPSPTGLEELETISSLQKVWQWLEVHVPSDPGTLAKEDEDCENKTDKEQSREILEEDTTCPVPPDMWEDSYPSQYVSEEYSDQDLFQREEDENKAAALKAVSKLQSISPALAGSWSTKSEAAMSRYQLRKLHRGRHRHAPRRDRARKVREGQEGQARGGMGLHGAAWGWACWHCEGRCAKAAAWVAPWQTNDG